jgi:hypothetical protein
MTALLVVCGTLIAIVLLVVIAAVVAGRHQSPKTFCYFAGCSVEISGLELGKSECQGRAEIVYVARSGSPSEVLTGSKACSVHAEALKDLGIRVENGGAAFFWRVPIAR